MVLKNVSCIFRPRIKSSIRLHMLESLFLQDAESMRLTRLSRMGGSGRLESSSFSGSIPVLKMPCTAAALSTDEASSSFRSAALPVLALHDTVLRQRLLLPCSERVLSLVCQHLSFAALMMHVCF